MAFTQLSNPKAVLETTLRNHSCSTAGDTIMVMHNNNKFYFDVLEMKPSWAVSVIETDCDVDFAVPLDYKEPTKEKMNAEQKEDEAVNKFVPFKGNGRRLDGKSSTVLVNSLDSSRLKEHKEKASCSSDTRIHGLSSRKLVFGSNAVKPSKESGKVQEDKSTKTEQPSFKAFSGKSYKLMD